MAKQIKARRVASNAKVPVSGRELWLAGLGFVSLGRKQARATFEAVNAGAVKFERRARADVAQVVESAASRTELLRTQAEGVFHDVRGFVVPAAINAQGLVADAIAQADRLAQPLLVKLGVVKTPARRASAKRKTTAAKPAAKAPAKPAAARKAPARRSRKAA